MADIIDNAARYVDAEIEHQVKKASAGVRTGKQGLSECEDCGDPIPEARRKAVPGCTRCVSCQEETEKNRGNAL